MTICSSPANSGTTPAGDGAAEPDNQDLALIHLTQTGDRGTWETNANEIGANAQAVAIVEGSVGEHTDFAIEFPCTITGVRVLATPSGSITLDVRKAVFGAWNNPASIVGATMPGTTATDSYVDTTLTGWSTTVTAGDCFQILCTAVSGVDKASLMLKLRRRNA